MINLVSALMALNLVVSAEPSIHGVWKYTSYTYQGHNYLVPDPTFDLRFNFSQDGKVNLKWFHEGEPGFCERIADYVVNTDGSLSQTITWVNPDNEANCSSDSDMQLGRVTKNFFSIKDNELSLHLELNGEPFFYNLTRVSPQSRTERNP